MMMGGGMRGEDPDVDMRLEEQKIDMRGSANMHLGGMMNKLPGQNEYDIMESYRKQEEYEKCKMEVEMTREFLKRRLKETFEKIDQEKMLNFSAVFI
jgi:alpha-D-ribose 1-methylphosphonate 5-triphosphate diphosphatase PhnM